MHIKILANTFYQVLQKIITASITLFTTILIARTLGVEGYGSFIQITTIVGMLYLLVDFGLTAIVLHIDVYKHFGSLLWLRIIFALLSMLVIGLLATILPYNGAFGVGFSPATKIGMVIFSITLLSQALQLSAAAIYQKELRYLVLLIATLIGSLVTAAGVFYAFETHQSLFLILVSFVIGNLITSILAILFMQSRVQYTPLFSTMKSLFLSSIPLGLMLIFNLIYFRVDIFLLSLLKPTADVGIYGLSYRFFDFLIALPLFLSNALYPKLVENQKNLRKNDSVVFKYLCGSIAFAIFLSAALWFLAPFITLVKQDFMGSVASFRLLLLSLPFFFATSLLQWALIAEKKQFFLMWVYLGSAIVNIGLNILLIPSGSYLAAALITGISEALVFLVLASYFYMKIFRSAL